MPSAGLYQVPVKPFDLHHGSVTQNAQISAPADLLPRREDSVQPWVDEGGRENADQHQHRDRKREKREEKREEAPRSKRDTAVTPSASGDQARLFISLGKKHGVSADDLRTLLAGPIGGDTSRIGSVSLRDSHAHVRVPEDVVDAIISGVHGTLHNDHNVTVERARA